MLGPSNRCLACAVCCAPTQSARPCHRLVKQSKNASCWSCLLFLMTAAAHTAPAPPLTLWQIVTVVTRRDTTEDARRRRSPPTALPPEGHTRVCLPPCQLVAEEDHALFGCSSAARQGLGARCGRGGCQLGTRGPRCTAAAWCAGKLLALARPRRNLQVCAVVRVGARCGCAGGAGPGFWG